MSYSVGGYVGGFRTGQLVRIGRPGGYQVYTFGIPGIDQVHPGYVDNGTVAIFLGENLGHDRYTVLIGERRVGVELAFVSEL